MWQGQQLGSCCQLVLNTLPDVHTAEVDCPATTCSNFRLLGHSCRCVVSNNCVVLVLQELCRLHGPSSAPSCSCECGRQYQAQ